MNFHEIDKLYYLLADVGVKNIGIAAYYNSFSGRGGNELSLSEKDIEKIYSISNSIVQKETTYMGVSIPSRVWKEKEDIIACGALFHTMIILPNGDVTVCEQMIGIDELHFGNIRDNSIMEIWTGEKTKDFFFNKTHPTDDRCKLCGYLDTCQTGCFAEKYYKGSNMFGRDVRCNINNNKHSLLMKTGN